ncbi:MAG TPA: bifunctional phosphoribosylaminoimidazolecarboxamide formyltransferase/IMP cyclohydrolase [Pyrinomonadaceae bacterium]|nr:bifunctional phosphoribosylaminoimidazolecarboxamide formyltransferase/IMP cyclohydrolase [Pyrinomonadaceae bacterium]
MTTENELQLVKIRRALISVSDKTGIVDFARELKRFDVEIISTGGTASALRDAGIEVRDVSDVTGFPEMMDGRIKTLHPKIHGALLGLRDNAEHLAAMNDRGIEPIDMVVVNLYPFEETIKSVDVIPEVAIEQIDIGGPAMIRSAAKNFESVAVVPDTRHYEFIIHEMGQHDGALTIELRQELACDAFSRTSAYDGAIFAYLNELEGKEFPQEVPPDTLLNCDGLVLHKISDLRYGENPHQQADLYRSEDPFRDEESSEEPAPQGIVGAELLSGKEMSFNNYVDADAAWQLVCDFDDLACAIIKHTNPAGVALGTSNEEAYRKALACDPVSAFGGIVAFNTPFDEDAARAITEIFTEVIIAPDYEPAALEVLKTKKNLRVLRAGRPESIAGLEYKQISGGMLVQTRDTHRMKREDLKVVTKRAPSDKEIEDLLFAWTVCKHTKSNAIVYVRDRQTVGVGAGQMSRVDSVKIGAMRAQLPTAGSVLASDAFFPFRDGLDEAAKHGITAVIQPGGSVRDEEVMAAADEHGLAMVFTGIRHFKH